MLSLRQVGKTMRVVYMVSALCVVPLVLYGRAFLVPSPPLLVNRNDNSSTVSPLYHEQSKAPAPNSTELAKGGTGVQVVLRSANGSNLAVSSAAILPSEMLPCREDPTPSALEQVKEFLTSGPVDFSNCTNLPDTLIIGFEKCGTMTLLNYLKLNPEIHAISSYNHRGFYKGVDSCRYLASLDPTPPGTVRVEKLAMHNSPEVVYKVNKDVKLLAIVRDPVSRLVSHFAQQVDLGLEEAGTISEVVNQSLDHVNNKGPECTILFSSGMYSTELRPWLRYFSQHQLHIVNGTNFIVNPAYELSLVEKFLGVKSAISEDNFVFNATKGFYCLNDSSLQSCMKDDKGRPHPSVSPTVLQRVRDFFRPHNEDFFSMFGVRYPWNDV